VPRLVLVWSMAGAFILALLLPVTKEFFALVPPPLLVWLAAFGIAALVWSLARLFLPPERPVGPGVQEDPVVSRGRRGSTGAR
jgi:hypothetical protein